MQSNQTVCVDEIKKSIILAIERTGFNISSIDSTALDIFNEFKSISLFKVREAIRKGSLGEYGISYRLSTQEICIWIKKYLEVKKTKLNF